MLSRRDAIGLRDTDRSLARLVGGLLSAAELGSESMVDAHVVATAIEQGGGVCLTGDVADLDRIDAGAASDSRCGDGFPDSVTIAWFATCHERDAIGDGGEVVQPGPMPARTPLASVQSQCPLSATVTLDGASTAGP